MSKQRETKEQVNNMLQELGKRVLQALQDGDAAYAGAVRNTVYPESIQGTDSLRAKLGQGVATAAGVPVLQGLPRANPDPRKSEFGKAVEHGVAAAIPVSNVAIRYGVPATAAGVGLMELAKALSREEGEEQPDELVRIQ